jgi:hypothetical protein
MHGQTIAGLMAQDSTRRAVHGPAPEPAPRRRTRRALAGALQAAAHRLDPAVTAPRRAQVGH